MIPKKFDYYSPATLQQAVQLLREIEGAKILAGGQNLLPLMKLRLAAPTALVDISKLSDLFYVRDWGEHLAIGALTTYDVIEHNRVIKEILAVQAQGASILTVEGLAEDDRLHPMQEAFRENHGLQCGFCTPGLLMSSLFPLQRNPHHTEEEIRRGIEGNFCRCTGYINVIKSVEAAAEAMANGKRVSEL